MQRCRELLTYRHCMSGVTCKQISLQEEWRGVLDVIKPPKWRKVQQPFHVVSNLFLPGLHEGHCFNMQLKIVTNSMVWVILTNTWLVSHPISVDCYELIKINPERWITHTGWLIWRKNSMTMKKHQKKSPCSFCEKKHNKQKTDSTTTA